MTTYRAAIKVARAYDTHALLGPVRGSGEVYEPGGLKFLSGDSVPLLIDHDPARVIGLVHEFVTWPWVDQRWVVARCTIDAAPDWLRRGVRASFSYKAPRSYEVNGWKVVSRALVDEVSVLSASHKPVEACAEVALLKRTPAATAPVGEVVYGDGTLIRRNIGQVLGVRWVLTAYMPVSEAELSCERDAS